MRLSNPNSTYVLLAVFAGALTVMMLLTPLVSPLIGLPLNYFSSVPLFIIGLSLGERPVLIASLSAFTVLLIAMGAVSAFMLAGAQLLPAFILTHLALKHQGDAWYPATYLVAALTMLSIAGLTFFVLWAGLVVHDTPLNVLKLNSALNQFPELEHFFKWTIGFLGTSWVLMNSFNILLAQRLLQLKDKALRPYPTERDLEPVPYWDCVFLAGGLAALTPYATLSFWGINCMALSAIPLFLNGLRIFYLWFLQFKIAKSWFFMMLLLMFILICPLGILIILGLFDPLLRLYPRLKDNARS